MRSPLPSLPQNPGKATADNLRRGNQAVGTGWRRPQGTASRAVVQVEPFFHSIGKSARILNVTQCPGGTVPKESLPQT